MALPSIRIDRLALHARHGAKEAERSLGQRFYLDIEFTADIEKALASDALVDSVHYGEVIKAATRTFTARDYNLIEAAAAAAREGSPRSAAKSGYCAGVRPYFSSTAAGVNRVISLTPRRG